MYKACRESNNSRSISTGTLFTNSSSGFFCQREKGSEKNRGEMRVEQIITIGSERVSRVQWSPVVVVVADSQQ